jgi:hypothetical protein
MAVSRIRATLSDTQEEIMKIAALLLPLLLAAAPAAAYDLLLDIDIDGDPATINETVDGDSATIRLVLRPSDEAPEWISSVTFGMGGTCWECLHQGFPYTYGSDCDLYYNLDDWHDNPLFTQSVADISLCFGCCNGNGNGQGYHYIFTAIAAGGGFSLEEPIFIAGFEAWVSRSVAFDRCPHPPADLITFPRPFGGPTAEGNRIQIGDEFTPATAGSWSAIKSLY